MKKFTSWLKSRRLYYSLAVLLVLVANANALIEPVSATVDYVWSRQESVVVRLGRWDTMSYESPVNAIHAALLNTGKVLLIAGSGNNEQYFDAKSFRTVLWDPTTNVFTEIPTPWDAFCAGHVFLPDGKLLVAGGTKNYEDLTQTPRVDYGGLKDSYIFDPATERYEKVDNMDVARWYPTLVTLGDGKVLAAAGLGENGQKSDGQTEIYDPATKQWDFVKDLNHVFPTYPALFLTGDGRLFYSGSNQGYFPSAASKVPGFWDLKTNNFQPVTGLPADNATDTSASVLLPPAQDQRVMVLGGGGDGDSPITTNRTAIIDLDASANPTYQRGPDLQEAVRYPGVVILPDDTVLKTGGSSAYRANNVLSAQIFHPDTNTFTPAASPRVGRNYHSEAILLPDGRVATFGSNSIDNSFEMRIEVYSPAYMFKGKRLSINSGAKELWRNSIAHYNVSDPTQVKTAKLMRPSAVTHVTDVEQRSIALAFTPTEDGIDVHIPENANLVPPGWYMAFVTDRNDVPSEAFWVHVN